MGIFTDKELKARQERLQKGLAKRKVDVAFIHSADNVYYTTGIPLLSEWGRPMWAVFDVPGKVRVIGAAIEKENMEENARADEVLPYADDTNVVQASLRLVGSVIGRRKSKPKRIGIEREIMSLGLHDALQAQFPGTEFVEIGDIVTDLRIIKSAEELGILQLGATIAKLGANAFLEALDDNATELTVAGHAVNEMNKALGALYPGGGTSTYAYAQFARHTLTPHLHPTGQRLRRGDLVALNVFPVIWGYCMELERTFVFGEPTRKQQKPLDAVNEAFDAAKAYVGPGVAMNDVDNLTRKMLKEAGFGRYIRHGTGHAHGIMIGSASREEPGELRYYNKNRLRAGMANSVEPGVYIPEIGGFRHSDVMFITDKGAVCVTDFPRDILY